MRVNTGARTPTEETVMILSPARIEQTLNNIEASVIPETHPAMAKIKRIWGDHTYFLDVNGLNIVEPVEGPESGAVGAVINLANWSDGTATSLTPHEPEATDVVVEFDAGDGSDAMH
jgi:hypothetical protein